jgi:TolB-like protein/tetratricopeptide (TPR) repeat protein/tRNA A-37 threonylcarbamoyl transferase component Bud32
MSPPMDEARMARLAELFDRLHALPRPLQPAALRLLCGRDEDLRQELSSLLAAHRSSDGSFDALAEKLVAPLSDRHVPDASGLASELARTLEGSYRIERELGGGAMSRVFLAVELRLGREVVIKVLPPELAETVSGERFRREIQLAAQLQHAHIVPLLTAEASGRVLYYTMPFIRGESLRERLTRDRVLPVREATRIWRDLLDALSYAHARGVVHRDIKPGNILLDGRNALVTDFGIARAIAAAAGDGDATTPGITIGTPKYMAPEQLSGGSEADHRVDVYGAALVMYEMLEGRLPFTGHSSQELLAARLVQAPRPVARADCPPGLATMVLRCLARDPAARPGSADVLLTELESYPGADATPGSGDAARRPGHARRRLVLTALAAVIVSAGALGARYLIRDSANIPAAAPPPAIAVLPFVSIGAGGDAAALADGMTEELITILGQGGRLRVVASPSVRALQDRQLAVRQIAESLHVSHVLEGALQRVGSKLRIEVRLVDARNGSMQWSETYDRQLRDIFGMQEDIARAVAGELDVRLVAGPGPGSSERRRYTPSIAAYEWYLRGRQMALQRSGEGHRAGIDYFRRAIAADSSFAAAYAGLVWMYLNEAGSRPDDYREWIGRAEASALKAVALDETLPEAHSALGWARLAHGQWAPAETAFTQAIALDPAAFRGYEGLARLYMFTGRPAEQLAAARRGLELDPYSVQATREVALALNMNGRCDETLQLLRPLKELTPPAGVAGVIRGQCYALKQMWPEAIAEFRWAMETSEARAALAFLGYALARGDRGDEARGILADLLAGRKHSHGAFGIAVVYAGLRDYEQVFTWLEKAVDEGSLRAYIMDPLFEDLHLDPRFDRLLQPR